MAESLKELRELTDEQVASRYNEIARRTVVGTDYYAAELNRRYYERHSEAMLDCTEQMLQHASATRSHSEEMLGLTNRIKLMTVIITVATLINAGVAIGMLCAMLKGSS